MNKKLKVLTVQGYSPTPLGQDWGDRTTYFWFIVHQLGPVLSGRCRGEQELGHDTSLQPGCVQLYSAGWAPLSWARLLLLLLLLSRFSGLRLWEVEEDMEFSFEHLLTVILLGRGPGLLPGWSSPVMSTWISGLSCWSQGWSQTVNSMQGWERRKQGNSQGKWKVMSFDKTGEEHLHPAENWPLALLSSRHWPTERLEGMMDDSEWEMTCLGSHSEESSVLCLQVWLGGSLGKQKVGRGVCGHVWTNSSHKSLSWILKMDACRLIHFARWINAGGKVLS